MKTIFDDPASGITRGNWKDILTKRHVARHPRGGFTIAEPLNGGTACTYHGNFSTRAEALRALSARVEPKQQSVLQSTK